MLMKLTYYGKGAPTLVNTERIQTIYQLFDKTQGRFSTKITFNDNTYVNVEEDLEFILRTQQEFYEGKYQDPTCVTPSIESRFQENYNSDNTPTYPTRRPRVRVFDKEQTNW